MAGAYQYVARKIKRNRWDSPDGWLASELPADALTGGCLKTTDNTLSLWQFQNPAQDLTEVALALAATFDNLDTFHIAWIHRDQLSQFTLAETTGQTPVLDLRDRHIDLCDLRVDGIVDFATCLHSAVRNDQCCEFRTKVIIDILKMAVANKRLPLEQLKPNVVKRLS